jgi:hypothetical protein
MLNHELTPLFSLAHLLPVRLSKRPRNHKRSACGSDLSRQNRRFPLRCFRSMHADIE